MGIVMSDVHACVERIQAFFLARRPAEVRAVYVFGSAATGDVVGAYSDIDILVACGEEVGALVAALRDLNDRLIVVNFHLHGPADLPVADLYLRIRLANESRLLYGAPVLDSTPLVNDVVLRDQLRAGLSHRIVMLRALACSPALARQEPLYTLYYAQKFALYGVRGLLMVEGERRTDRRHVVERFLAEPILPTRSKAWLANVLRRIDVADAPRSVEERVETILGCAALLADVRVGLREA